MVISYYEYIYGYAYSIIPKKKKTPQTFVKNGDEHGDVTPATFVVELQQLVILQQFH